MLFRRKNEVLEIHRRLIEHSGGLPAVDRLALRRWRNTINQESLARTQIGGYP